MINKRIFLMLLILGCFLFFGCQTANNVGISDFAVLVVDENDSAVPGVSVSIGKSRHATSEYSDETDSKGMCVFPKFPNKKVSIVCSKNGYTKIVETNCSMGKGQNIICFKIKSANKILLEVMDLYSKDYFEEGIELLDSILFEKKDKAYYSMIFYKAVGYLMIDDLGNAQKEMKIIKKTGMDETKEYIKKLNEIIEEKKWLSKKK